MFDLRIVVVNYNVRHFLSKCLDSILKSDLGSYTVDVWVVDNDSVDGSVSFLQENYPWVKLIANKENVGFAKANNQALKVTDAKNVLLLNPDTILSTDTISKSLDYLYQHKNIGALGVKMIDGDGKFLPESKRAKPSPWNSLCKLSGLSNVFPKSKLFSGYNLGYLSDEENHQIEVLCGAFMLIPVEVLEKVGLLDERFFMYAEDIDLSVRIKEAGYDVAYLADTKIIHYKGESTKKASANYVKTFYGAMYLYVEKHYAEKNGKLFLYFIKMGILLRAFISLLKRWLVPLIKPALDGLFIFTLLGLVKNYWAAYRFGDIHYYDNTQISTYLIYYSIIWVLSLMFAGWYLGAEKLKHLFSGVALGTALILILYALLPEGLRTSRAIILIGSGLIVFLLLITNTIYKFLNTKVFKNENHSTSNILLVADKENEKSLVDKLKLNNQKSKIIGLINPKNEANDNYYLNELKNIGNVCKDLRIDEIIFNSDDMDMSNIIKTMENLPSGVRYRIGGGSHLGLIGSKVKEDVIGLYSLDINYNIDGLIGKRSKRLLDFLVGVLFLIVSPIASVFTMSFNFVKRSLQLVLGQLTLFSYGGESKDFQSLPNLKKGFYTLGAEDGDFKTANFNYAKYYHILKDIKLLLKRINKK